MKHLLKKIFVELIKKYLFKSYRKPQYGKVKYFKPKKKKGLKYLIKKKIFD